MNTDTAINMEQKILEALGMGDRTDVSEIHITILPQQLPLVTIVTELINPDGLEPFFSYVSDCFELVPNDGPAISSHLTTDQPE